jgi:hypothetical protein
MAYAEPTRIVGHTGDTCASLAVTRASVAYIEALLNVLAHYDAIEQYQRGLARFWRIMACWAGTDLDTLERLLADPDALDDYAPVRVVRPRPRAPRRGAPATRPRRAAVGAAATSGNDPPTGSVAPPSAPQRSGPAAPSHRGGAA